jgi:hypothetical protein
VEFLRRGRREVFPLRQLCVLGFVLASGRNVRVSVFQQKNMRSNEADAFGIQLFSNFIESIDDPCIHCDGGCVAANQSLVAEIRKRGLRKTTKETGLDPKTIRAILNGKKVKTSTLAKVVRSV